MRTEKFDTPEPVRLDIRIPAGDVEVETADLSETTVEVDASNEDDVTIERRGRDLLIEAPQRAFRNGSYRVRVVTPHGADLRANLGSADLVGRGRLADVDVNVASGDVSLGQVEGEAAINTASGDLDVRDARGTRVNSASGDVRLRRVAEGDVRVETASGDVEVGIAAGSRLRVDAQSLAGDVTSELELDDAPSDDSGPLVELRVQSMSGDIAVRRG